MARLLAAVLAAWVSAAPARGAQVETEVLRPLAVDLRRLYPDLVQRWDEAELNRFARTRQGFVPIQGFLAGPEAPRASLPARAAGVVSVRSGGVRLRERLLGARPAEGVAEQGLLRYRGAFRHTEALFVAGDRVAAPMFLQDRPDAPDRIAAALQVSGGRAAATQDGGVTVRGAGGSEALSLTPPVVLDARGRRRAGRWVLRGGAKGDYVVVLTFDPSGLAYPLLVR